MALILKRSAGQSVVINPNSEQQATVTVLEVRGGIVKLGFEADKEQVPIVRTEVLERTTREAA